MAGYSQLDVYNRALSILGERAIATLTEQREPRRQLDAFYTDAVNFCLAQGNWKHSLRAIYMQLDPSVNVQFGWGTSFDEPSDWVRTYKLSNTPDFSVPLNNYMHQQGKFFTNDLNVYMNYVSNDPQFGWSLAKWRPGFFEYVAAYLAFCAGPRITQSMEVRKEVAEWLKKTRSIGLSNDAFDDPTVGLPTGSWVQSRRRGGGYKNIYPTDGW